MKYKVLEEYISKYTEANLSNLYYVKLKSSTDAYVLGLGMIMNYHKYAYIHLDQNGLVVLPVDMKDGSVDKAEIIYFKSSIIDKIDIEKKLLSYSIKLKISSKTIEFNATNTFFGTKLNRTNLYNLFQSYN